MQAILLPSLVQEELHQVRLAILSLVVRNRIRSIFRWVPRVARKLIRPLAAVRSSLLVYSNSPQLQLSLLVHRSLASLRLRMAPLPRLQLPVSQALVHRLRQHRLHLLSLDSRLLRIQLVFLEKQVLPLVEHCLDLKTVRLQQPELHSDPHLLLPEVVYLALGPQHQLLLVGEAYSGLVRASVLPLQVVPCLDKHLQLVQEHQFLAQLPQIQHLTAFSVLVILSLQLQRQQPQRCLNHLNHCSQILKNQEEQAMVSSILDPPHQVIEYLTQFFNSDQMTFNY